MQSISNLVNQEALDSQIYNPTVEKSVLMLQQIMETTPYTVNAPKTSVPLVDPASVAPELREHVTNFNSLSLQNPFQGVIVNPATCLIEDLTRDLDLVPITCDVKWGGNPIWEGYKPGLNSDISDINNGCDTIQDHTDRLTSNLPSLAGLAQSALALSTVMNLLSNPCLGLDGMMGSIMASGKQLLNDVKSKIRGALDAAKAWVDANIGPIVDTIKAAISDAKAKIAAFVAKAKAEVLNFAKAMLAQVRQGLAELMSNLPKDPCLRGLLQSAATGAAAAIIK